ncbi:hypothetical protein [Mycolicibacterium sp.]|uniref:hypothetical protein n=1 Tax=Mycolicibacterium sp. TaxID=2320850 RepID=UPI0037C80B65
MADVDHWDPGQIDEVSEALVERARHSGTAAEELRGAREVAEWEGEAGDAAKHALERSAVVHESSAQNDVLAAMAAKKAAGDVRAVKNQQKDILEDAAAAPAVSINLETNTIIPPDTTGWEEEDVTKLADKMRDLRNRIVAMLAAAQEADENLARVFTAAAGGEPEAPAEHGVAGTDPAALLSELQRATDQAVVDQMAKIQGIQKRLDDVLATMYTSRPGSPEFDAANNIARNLKGELATALNDLGNIPNYSQIDPKSITVSPDGHFLINATADGVPYQVHGQFRNGTGEFFDQAKGTSYTFKGGTLVSTNTPDPGKVTPDDELLFNAVTTAVGAPEAALAAKGLSEAGIHGLKTLLGREAFEGAASLTGDNVIPKALVAAEARADDAAANLAGHHPAPTPDRPTPLSADNPPDTGGHHPAPGGPSSENSAPPTVEHGDHPSLPEHSASTGHNDVTFPDPSRPTLGSDDRYHIPEGATDTQIDVPGDLGKTITDIDRVENGVLWEEKSATSAGNPEQWVDKQFVNKMEKYIESQQYIAGMENAPIGIRFTNPGVDPALQAAVEKAAADLRAKHPGVTILIEWTS